MANANANEAMQCTAGSAPRTPRHEELMQAVSSVTGTLEHVRMLAQRLGVDMVESAVSPCKDEPIENLVSALVFLPEEVGRLTSKIHDVLNEIENNLT